MRMDDYCIYTDLHTLEHQSLNEQVQSGIYINTPSGIDHNAIPYRNNTLAQGAQMAAAP
jgi:hypothetical protein